LAKGSSPSQRSASARVAEAPEPGEVCALPRVRRGYKIGFWAVALLLAFMLAYPYFTPYFY